MPTNTMSIYAAWDMGCSDEEWQEIQENRAKVVMQCRAEGHQWGAWRADLNDQLFRCCVRCGVCDDSKREPEHCV